MTSKPGDNEVGRPHQRDEGASERRQRHARPVGGAQLMKERSMTARKHAAAILEVLAGARTTGQAAEALGVSLPRYYQLEQRALEGLLSACEPRPMGRVRSEASVSAKLRKENERLQRELSRQQTLVRLTQRSMGLPAAAPAAKMAGKKRRRRPAARALAVAARLREEKTVAAAEPTGV
jgi:hypothetical protein